MMLECFDCAFFKARGLSCPRHATPEERAATEVKIPAMLATMPKDPEHALLELLGFDVGKVPRFSDDEDRS